MHWTPAPDDPAPRGARAERMELRGRSFAALAWGAPEGAPTILLHGFLDHAGSWSRVAPALGGWVLAPDLRGHGRSAWNGPGESYHFPEYLADLDALVAAIGASVRLVGHSMGGTLATIYAGARPERVTGLVVVDGLGLADAGAGARGRMVQFLDGMRREPTHRVFPRLEDAAARLVATWGVAPDWAAELALRGTRSVAGGFVWSYDPRHRARAAVPYRQDQHRRFLEAIACPVLSVRARRSLFASEDVAALEAAVPALRACTLDAGHMVQLDAPDALAEAVVGFLDR